MAGADDPIVWLGSMSLHIGLSCGRRHAWNVKAIPQPAPVRRGLSMAQSCGVEFLFPG